MTPKAAAKRLNVGLPYIYSLIWSGKLPAEKVDGVWQVDEKAVMARASVKWNDPEAKTAQETKS